MSESLIRVIRRFRVRIPGRFEETCWPNGKAPDYGVYEEAQFHLMMHVCEGWKKVPYDGQRKVTRHLNSSTELLGTNNAVNDVKSEA